MLAAGRLREQIVIQRPDTIDNGKGGRKPNPVTGGWAQLDDVWAEVIPLRGDEAVRNNLERAVQLWRVTIRHRGDVTPACRIVWADIVMSIKSAAPGENRAALVMTCESGATGL